MRRAIFFTLATVASAAVFGQSLLDCVEPDVLRALLLQSQGETPPVITVTVPVELSALKMPREFTWIGSAERDAGRVDASTNATTVTAAWRSSLAPAAARAAASTALTASGWEVQQRPGMTNPFDSPSTQPSLPLCRDGKSVNVAAYVMDAVTYMLFTLQRGNNNSICNQPLRDLKTASNSRLEQYLPHLEMPVDPATGVTVRSQGGGGSSSSTSFSARTEFTSKDMVGNVARHFARQMAEQGWSSDANWSGAATAGSTWSKQTDAGLIQGTLTFTSVDDGKFAATLRINRLQ